MSADFTQTVCALVITYNEAPNIDRTLSKLAWVRRVLVVDSGSSDDTQRIIARFPNAQLVERPFDTFAGQCNFGLAHPSLDSDWVLSLDADYVLSDELVAEIARLRPADDVHGYRAQFRYAIFGHAIRSGIYPSVVVLFRKRSASYRQDGHAHRVVVDGRVDELTAPIFHDDRKPLARWLDSQRAYARNEADHLGASRLAPSGWRDRIRLRVGIAPLAVFVYVYVVRGGFLDGRQGLYYALQRAYAELLLSLELLDRRLRRDVRA
jgi:glycosyltransferase involved in cell wall biosynthesis